MKDVTRGGCREQAHQPCSHSSCYGKGVCHLQQSAQEVDKGLLSIVMTSGSKGRLPLQELRERGLKVTKASKKFIKMCFSVPGLMRCSPVGETGFS